MSAQFVTPAELAAELEVSPNTVRRWINEGRISSKRINGRLQLIDRADLGNIVQEIVIAPRAETLHRVYLIQAETGGPIKCGVSRDPDERLRQLQRMNPLRLRILAILDGGYEREAELHEALAEYRLHGEWFSEDCPALQRLARGVEFGDWVPV